jgi:ComF family protein
MILKEIAKKIRLNLLKINNWLKKNQSCLLCEGETNHIRGWIFCSPCLAHLPWLTQTCLQCGINVPEKHLKCSICLNSPPYFDQTVTVFAYEQPISKMLIQYKYQGALSYLPTFADMLALRIRADYQKRHRPLPDIIFPVPLSIPRLKQRGFNQSLELAKRLSQYLGVAYQSQVILRKRDTPMQAGLSLKQRQANLKNAFELSSLNNIRRFVKNKRIALVDDVLTTGSTLETLSKLLKEAGAYSVDAWVLARTLATIS